MTTVSGKHIQAGSDRAAPLTPNARAAALAPIPEGPVKPSPAAGAQAAGASVDSTVTPSSFRPGWDLIGIAGTTVTVLGAAIFFIAGWVYESHWYGFYGIDISQTKIYPAMAMVEGVPGIFVFLVSLTLIWQALHVFQAVIARNRRRESISNAEQSVRAGRNEGSKSPPWVAGVLTYISMTAGMGVFNFSMIQRHPDVYQTPLIAFDSLIVGFVIVFLAVNAQVLAMTPTMRPIIAGLVRIIRNRSPRGAGLNASTITPFVGIGFLTFFSFMLLFITSISASALLGVYDAIHAQRSLSSWKMPIVYIVTTSRADVLRMISSDFVFVPNSQEQSAEQPAYGPFGLIYSDDQKYYLIWLAGDYQISDISIPDPFQARAISGEARKKIAAQWHNGAFVSQPIILTVDRDGTNLISASVFIHSGQP